VKKAGQSFTLSHLHPNAIFAGKARNPLWSTPPMLANTKLGRNKGASLQHKLLTIMFKMCMMAYLKAGIKFKKHETIFASKDFIKLKAFLHYKWNERKRSKVSLLWVAVAEKKLIQKHFHLSSKFWLNIWVWIPSFVQKKGSGFLKILHIKFEKETTEIWWIPPKGNVL
jgi:hypothetical protein